MEVFKFITDSGSITQKIIILLAIVILLFPNTGCLTTPPEPAPTATPLPAHNPSPSSEETPSLTGNTSWPMFCHDPYHTGFANYLGPLQINLKWVVKTEGEVHSSPVTGKDGTVYTGSDDGNLYSISPDGSISWKFKTEGKIRATPAVSKEGNIYILSGDGFLYSINPAGELNWKIETAPSEKPSLSSPIIDEEGNIYTVAGNDDEAWLYSISPEGKEKWKVKSEKNAFPVMDREGNILINSNGIQVYSPGGELKYTIEEGKTLSAPAVSKEDIIYTGSSSDESNKINAVKDGKIKWSASLKGYVKGNISIDGEGNIYTGCYDGKIYSFGPDGKEKWTFKTKDIIISGPSIDGEGNIYAGSYDTFLYSIDKYGNLQWKFKCGGGIVSTPAVGTEETIIWGCLDGNIYAVHSGEKGANINIPSDKTPEGLFSGNLYGQNTERNWQSIYRGPSVPALKWEVRLGEVVSTSPVINKGTIYIGTGERDKNSMLYAINKDGKIEWVYEGAGKTILTDPVLDKKGNIYFTTWNQQIIALSRKGKLLWKFKGNDSFKFPPVTGDNNLVYASCGNEVYCLSEEGDLKWKTQLEDIICTPPLPGPEGIVYQPTLEGYVFIIDEKGRVKKKREIKTELSSGTADREGNLYLAGADGLYISKNDGTTEKVYSLSENMNITEEPALNASGEIIIITEEYIKNNSQKITEILCLTKKGSLRWRYEIEGEGLPPIIGSDNTVYVATEKGKIYVFKRNGSLKWTGVSSGSIFNSPALSSDGSLFVPYSVMEENHKKIVGSGIEKIKNQKEKEDFFVFSNENNRSYPVIDKKGNVYISAGKEIYAIKPDGTVNWKKELNSPIKSYLSLDKESNIFLGGEDGIFKAFNSNGELLWSYKTKGPLESSPLIDREGFIYFGSYDGYFYCLDGEGKEKWKVKIGTPVTSPPVMGEEEIYIKSKTGYLYSIERGGKQKWKIKTGEKSFYTVFKDNIYIINEKGNIKALDKNKKEIWEYFSDEKPSVSPAYDSIREILYTGGEEGTIQAVDKEGNLKWSFKADGAITSSPLIDSGGNIYFKTSESLIYALNSHGIKKWVYNKSYSQKSLINLSPEEVLTVSEGGFVYTIGE